MAILAKMPSRDRLPPGPERDLVEALHVLYQATGGTATNRTMSDWTVEATAGMNKSEQARYTAAHTTVGALLNGTIIPGWEKTLGLARALRRHANRAVDLDEDRLLTLWKAARGQLPVSSIAGHGAWPLTPLDAHSEHPIHGRPETSSHFARMAYEWGTFTLGDSKDSLQGAVAISCAGENKLYQRVFSRDFAGYVEQAQEWTMRRSGYHAFETVKSFTPTSYRVWGNFIRSGKVVAFIAVEAHVHGVVTAYFRDLEDDYRIDRVCHWWVSKAGEACSYALRMMGATSRTASIYALVDSRPLTVPRPTSEPDEHDYFRVQLGYGHSGYRSSAVHAGDEFGFEPPAELEQHTAWSPWDGRHGDRRVVGQLRDKLANLPDLKAGAAEPWQDFFGVRSAARLLGLEP